MIERLIAVAILLNLCACPSPPPDKGGGDDDDETDRCLGQMSDEPANAPAVPPDIDGQLTINEFMARNALTILDQAGEPGDWVEIYNPTDQVISLEGYALTNNLAQPRKAVIPAGVEVPAGGYVVLWLDAKAERGPNHSCIQLRRDGGQLGLARPDGSYIDRIEYGYQATDFSAARTPDGSDSWRIEWHASPGAANPGGPGAPVGPEDEAASPETVPEAGDLSERILGYDELPNFELIISDDGIAALKTSPYEYVQGHLVFDGRRYGPIGVRLKGQNSFLPIDRKPSFRLNIDEYTPAAKFFGLANMTLNNMSSDFSMMHERIAYLVARQMGPASRANHAWVTVNGQPYGLYTNLETVKGRMIGRWFEDNAGPLFEATDVDFVPGDVDRYELQAGPDDRTMLAKVAQALLNSSADAAISAVANHVNMNSFWRFWAVCTIIGQWDSFPYSIPGDDYLVYADPTSGKLWFLPWGMDETFYSSEIDPLAVHSVLANKCLGSPTCRQSAINHMWNLLDVVEQMDLAGEVDRVAAQIAPYVAMDTRKPYPATMVTEFQMQMRWFVTGRRFHLTNLLPAP